MSLGKYKNGTLYFSKAALERLDKGDVMKLFFEKSELKLKSFPDVHCFSVGFEFVSQTGEEENHDLSCDMCV